MARRFTPAPLFMAISGDTFLLRLPILIITILLYKLHYDDFLTFVLIAHPISFTSLKLYVESFKIFLRPKFHYDPVTHLPSLSLTQTLAQSLTQTLTQSFTDSLTKSSTD